MTALNEADLDRWQVGSHMSGDLGCFTSKGFPEPLFFRENSSLSGNRNLGILPRLRLPGKARSRAFQLATFSTGTRFPSHRNEEINGRAGMATPSLVRAVLVKLA